MEKPAILAAFGRAKKTITIDGESIEIQELSSAERDKLSSIQAKYELVTVVDKREPDRTESIERCVDEGVGNQYYNAMVTCLGVPALGVDHFDAVYKDMSPDACSRIGMEVLKFSGYGSADESAEDDALKNS